MWDMDCSPIKKILFKQFKTLVLHAWFFEIWCRPLQPNQWPVNSYLHKSFALVSQFSMRASYGNSMGENFTVGLWPHKIPIEINHMETLWESISFGAFIIKLNHTDWIFFEKIIWGVYGTWKNDISWYGKSMNYWTVDIPYHSHRRCRASKCDAGMGYIWKLCSHSFPIQWIASAFLPIHFPYIKLWQNWAPYQFHIFT